VVTTRPLVSIIIPSAADPALLGVCLQSIRQHAPRTLRFETIVVVNKAGDYERVLRESELETTVVTSAVNLGLAGATNLARSKASGDFLLVFHDDSEARPGWLDALLDAAYANPKAGAIGGTVFFRDGRVQGAGNILWKDGTTSPPWVASPSPDIVERARAVDYVGTSSLLIPAATWDTLGGFDESFYPVYYVDVDFAMRVRRNGQFVWYEPRSQTHHHQGASGSLTWRYFVSGRNRKRFLEKWSEDLADYEERTDDPEQAIARALASTAERAAAAGGPSTPPSAPLQDPATQAERHRAMESALYREYSDHLASLLAENRNTIERLANDMTAPGIIHALEAERVQLQTLAGELHRVMEWMDSRWKMP